MVHESFLIQVSIKMSQRSILWVFNLKKWNPTEAEMLLATSCIQLEEKDRLSRFVFKNDVKSSLIGRLLMRKFVSENTDQTYDTIRFLRDEKSKPYLAGNSVLNVNFNVSHQGNYTVLAGNVEGPKLGVDISKCERPRGKSLNEYFRIMGRIFSVSEWNTIKQAGDDDLKQLGRFYRHWSLKESFLKAIGIGITINLQEVCFEVHTPDLKVNEWTCDTMVYFQNEKQNWEFQEMLLDEEHCVAIALDHSNNQIEVKELSFSDLMKNCIPLLEPDANYCNDFFRKLNKK